jgi:hypothetical protein
MHRKNNTVLILLVLLVSLLIPSTGVQAKVQNFESLYMEVATPEDTIIVAADTPNENELWSKIGVMSPKEEKKVLNQMGVRAILFDPHTRSSIKLIQKSSEKSSEIFNLSLISEEERQEFLESIFPSPDDSTTLHVAPYSQPEQPFFRIEFEMKKENIHAREIIYGTVVNGSMIYYDLYKENAAAPLEESYIKALVEGTHFTNFLDKAEVERQGRQSAILLAAGTGAIAVIVIVWVILSSRRNKRKFAVRKERTAALSRFYQDQRLKEEQAIKTPVLYTNRTVYSEEVIKHFCLYNTVFHHIKIWITTAAAYLLLLILSYQSNQAWIGYILSTIAVFFLVLTQSVQIEKNAKKIMKAYEHHKSKEATVQFYEDYYILSGIQSSGKNPYLQITEYKEYKNYIYLYLGSDRALYLNKEGFDKDLEEFRKFILDKIK